jgi:hypothetical protein
MSEVEPLTDWQREKQVRDRLHWPEPSPADIELAEEFVTEMNGLADALRPPGASNATWNLMQVGYEKPEVHWGWTREHERKP